MAKHCTNCGHELRDSDKFCSECGTPVGGVTRQTQPERLEYQTFSESLTGNFYGIEGVPMDGGLPTTPGGKLTREIEDAVDRMLDRAASAGWEPAEATDTNSLWKAQCVERKYKSSLFGNDKVAATKLELRFRRKVRG
jgi:zinc-ribbon domain